MSTYAGDDSSQLQESIRSLALQTHRPAQVVVVVDGPVGNEISDVLGKATGVFPALMLVEYLPENLGLGPALDIGLSLCDFELIMRMDSDDICVPERAEELLGAWLDIESGGKPVDLICSWHLEFSEFPGDSAIVKNTPVSEELIRENLLWRNVISHPTVLFRKEAVLKVGGYGGQFRFFEDHNLFVKMAMSGMALHCVPKTLLYFRVTDAQRGRRTGFQYWRTGMTMRWSWFLHGYLDYFKFIFGSGLFLLFCLSPAGLKPVLYKLVRINNKKSASL